MRSQEGEGEMGERERGGRGGMIRGLTWCKRISVIS